jgi:hypothetical protein
MRSVFRSWRDWRHVASVRGKKLTSFGVSGEARLLPHDRTNGGQIKKRIGLELNDSFWMEP